MDRGTGNDPEYIAPRKGDEEWREIVASAVREAVQYVEGDLGPERKQATEYYHGEKFGNEEKGRSQAVLTEVRDNILGVLPSILRVVHGPEHTVEYVPNRADAVPMAEQATDYVRYIFEQDNKGFLVTHSVLKDALLKRIGIVKWGMEETQTVKTVRYAGVTREDLAILAQDGEISAIEPAGEALWNAEISKTIPAGRVWVMPVPPDDFFWNRDARSLDDAVLVGNRTRLTKGQLRAMGVSEDDLEAYGGGTPEQTTEEQARRLATATTNDTDPQMGEAVERVLYCEAYVMLDMNNTGIPELRKVCTLGPGYVPIKNEPADEKPFAIYSPDPEPHAMLGGSWFHLLKDVQLINSQLLRGNLDSLSVSLFPRMAYVDGQVAVADLLNNAIGAPIRMRQPGMVQPFEVPYTGEKVMPMLSFMRDVVEQRVGQKNGAGSLDLDALQSTGKEAAETAIVAAQATVELLTRLYCEQLLKPLFRGLLKKVCHPASKERMVRLRGKYVPVNPMGWDVDMDVTVNVALGSMNTEKKIAVLSEVVADQTAIMTQFGAENPVVTLPMLRNAKAKVLSLRGIKDVDSYYKPLSDDYQPPPPAPPEPSPDELWIQAEKEMAFQKAMKELAIRQDELALEREKAALDGRLKERELVIREQEVLLKNTTGPHNAEIERYKANEEAAARYAQIESNERIATAKLELEREKMRVDAETARYAADKSAETARMAPKSSEGV